MVSGSNSNDFELLSATAKFLRIWSMRSRVTISLRDLEISENLTADPGEMSATLLKVRENILSGKREK